MDPNDSSSNDMWEWRDEEYALNKDPVNEYSHCLWDNVNDNNLMCMLEEQTPIKDCADFTSLVYDFCGQNVDCASKGLAECAESSQMKRRRMLHFSSDNAGDIVVDNARIGSVCLKSKVREDAMVEYAQAEHLEVDGQWNAGYQVEEAPIGWLAGCLDDTEAQCSLNEMDDCMPADEKVENLECNTACEMDTDVLQDAPNPSPIKIIKGGKSFLKVSKKLVTPVVYPFALIKPCGVQGDVTLRDINQRIHAPTPSSSKQKIDEDPSAAYPTSAFSGKPVVLKTKIRTEGGKGSITIMRTKG